MASRRAKQCKRVIVPRQDRVRRIGRFGFGWIDARIHKHGWMEVIGPDAMAVYTFLCLAADRNGVSWYRRDRIQHALGMGEDAARRALGRLRELDLVAYQPFSRHASDGFHQVMSLPECGPASVQELWSIGSDRASR